MMHRPISRAWLAGSALFALLSGPGMARADLFYETSYIPTSSVVTVPSRSILATSYVVPTAYSTTLLPTSSVYSVGEVLPTTTYVPTYRSFRYRPRRYVERTTYLGSPSFYSGEPTSYIVPTSYALPTTYISSSSLLPTTYISSSSLLPTSYLVDSGLVTTSATVPYCESAPSPPASPSQTSGTGSRSNGDERTITSKPETPPASGNERQPSGSVDDGPSSTVNPPVTVPATPRGTAGGAQAPIQEPPPVTPGASPATPPEPGVELPPPGAGGKSGVDETTTRRSLRPTYEMRNILRGKVVSFDSRQPQEGVTVILSSLTKNFTDRPTMTDAFGEFKIALPEGDWTVKVKMPSGSVLPVASDFLTATGGRVVDSSGRNVREFLITR